MSESITASSQQTPYFTEQKLAVTGRILTVLPRYLRQKTTTSGLVKREPDFKRAKRPDLE